MGKFSEGIRLEFCKDKRIEILNKIKHGEYVGKKFRITFYEVFKKYIQWAEHNKKTWKQDENSFEFHLKEFKNFDLRHLKPEIFESLTDVWFFWGSIKPLYLKNIKYSSKLYY